MNCPHCNESVDYILAHDCPQIVTPPTGPEPTREETLRSSDVVAELEAELGLQWKALNTAAQARDRNAYHAAFTRIVDIESSLATEPRRSATKKLSD